MTVRLLNEHNSSLFRGLELSPYTPLRGVFIGLAVTTAAIIVGVTLLSGSALLIAAAVLCR